ncbi:MAG: hypothetical protein KDC53_09735, partial [Saprospiraceae bacterium]|nr:hypothetical protein [Saprospiraceae bacterium]
MKNYYYLLMSWVLPSHFSLTDISKRGIRFFPGTVRAFSLLVGMASFLVLSAFVSVEASVSGQVTISALRIGGETDLHEYSLGPRHAYLQMDLDCHECYMNLNLSLDANCERLITAAMLLKNPDLAISNPEYFKVTLTIGNGLLISDNTLRAQHVGKEVSAMVTYLGPGPCPQGIACVTKITVKSEFEVTITPNPAKTVYCSDPFLKLDPSASDYEYRPSATQTCGVPVNGPFFGGDWVTIHDCVLGEQDTAKTILRQWWAMSKDGIRTVAMDTIYVLRLPPITADNFFCPEKDTLICGMSDHPIGPYMLVPNLLTMTDCDTIFFMDPNLKTNPIDPNCGLTVKIDSLEYENTGCVGLKRFIVEVHQNCYGQEVNTDCVLPVGSSHAQIEGGNGSPIYATCEFWLTDIDTVPPYISCNLDDVIIVGDDCEEGYTLSHGYWKTHSIFGPAPYDDTWALLPLGENTPFFLSGQTHYEVINAVPQGNAYYILAFQYVATKLNFLNGSDPSSVQMAYDQATALFMQYTPAEIGALPGNSPIRSQFIMLAMILDDYNTGDIGPGFCQEGVALPATTVEVGPDCTANFKLQKVMAMDACHEVKLVKAMVESFGFVTYTYDSVSGYWISEQMIHLELRDEPYLVVLEAIDECYNVGRDTCAIKVVDATNPVAVAHDGLIVDLSSKVGYINASQIDNNSSDNCELNLVLARRADWMEHWLEFCDTAEFVGHGTPDQDSIWCRNPDAANGEVEKIYADALATFATEMNPCDLLLYQSWYYDLCKYATVDCLNKVDETAFKEIYHVLFPETNIDIVSQIGGGWAERVPLTCSDVCDSVTVELLVMDYWCNWNKTWTKIFVEDKTPALVVSELTPSINLSCIAYNRDSSYTLAGSADRISMAEVFSAADTGNPDALALLDSLLGGYQKAWISESNDYVDVNGEIIDPSLTLIDSGICECHEEMRPVRYYDVQSQTFVTKQDSVVQVCGTTEEEIPLTKGIVAVNCNDNTHCIQDIDFDLDECGLGTVTRTFKIWKSCGVGVPDTITRSQTITLMNHCDLNKFMFDLPADTIVDGCAPQFDQSGNGNVIGFADPAITGEPVFNFEGACRIVAIARDDLVSTWLLPTGECYSILRTWYFADWCEIGTQDNWWLNSSIVADSFTQVIILVDTIAPTCEIDIAQVNDTVNLADCNDGLPIDFYTFDTCGSFGYEYQLLNIDGASPVERAYGRTNFAGDTRDTMTLKIPDVTPGTYVFVVTTTDACEN